jgi:DNA-binding YbaB/EbfC family protein
MLDAFKMAGTLAGLMKNKEAIKAAAERVKSRLGEVRATGSAGGGAVSVTVSGQMKVVRVELSPALAQHMGDMGSRTMAESLIAQAVNDAMAQAQAIAQKEVAKEAEAMGLPNMPGLEGILGG